MIKRYTTVYLRAGRSSTAVSTRTSAAAWMMAAVLLAAAAAAPAQDNPDWDVSAELVGLISHIESIPPQELRPTWRNQLLAMLDQIGVDTSVDACLASDEALAAVAEIDHWRELVRTSIDASHKGANRIVPQDRRLEVLADLRDRVLALRVAVLGASPAGVGCGGGATVTVDDRIIPVMDSLPQMGDGLERPLAAMRNARGIYTDFVENELWAICATTAQAEALADRLGAEIFDSITGDGDDHHFLLRVNEAKIDHELLPDLLEVLRPGVSDAVAVSSEAARNLLATAAAEAVMSADPSAECLHVGINILGLPDGIREGLTLDAISGPGGFAFTVSGWSRNAFNWLHYGAGFVQGIGVPEAWQLLELAGRLEATSVGLGVVDGGFLDIDLHPASIYRTTVPGFSGLGGENPLSPWHGVKTMQTAAGLVDNGIGGAGVAGPVALPINVYGTGDFFYSMAGIRTAIDNGARIVNMSFGAGVPSIFDWTTIPFRIFTGNLNNVLLVASAGNDGPGNDEDASPDQGNVDATECFITCWEAYFVTPCENPGVVCVGGLAHNSLNRSLFSNFGTDHDPDWLNNSTVDVYAPFCGAVAGPSSPAAETYCGTSHASPYVAGVFALMQAADPSMRPEDLPYQMVTRDDSPDEVIHRIVDAYSSVHAVLPPLINIISPADGHVTPHGVNLQFEAFMHPESHGEVIWASSRDGEIGRGDVIDTDNLSIGTHTVTASVAGLSSSISVHVGAIGILHPHDGQVFFHESGELDDEGRLFARVTLEGVASEPDGSPICCDDLVWTNRVEDGPPEVIATGNSATVQLHMIDLNATSHEITLTATDSAGNIQTFTVTVIVMTLI